MRWTWRRWGAWAAHLFDGETQSCGTQHPMAARYGRAPVVLGGTELTQQGVPYGSVCARCLKTWRRVQRNKVER